MKYDSSMTQYREDILLTVKQVFGRDINIINNYIPGYAVMSSLKDYLKNNYVNCGGTISDGLQCLCSQTKGLVISYTSPINNSGDKTLTLSWSQTAKFIMDNWEDVFVKSEPEEAAKAKPTYKDVLLEHYPDFDVSRFDEFLKVACIEYYFETAYPCNNECKSHWNSECLSKWSDEIEDCDLEIIKKYLVTNVGKEAPEPDKTYKDILLEHYPNFDESRFGDFIVNFCIDNFFDIGGFQCSYGVTSPANDDDFRECRKHWENKCLHEWRKENDKINLNDIEEYLIPKADEPSVQEIVPANAEEKPAVFDYSELDSDTADSLQKCENIIRQKTAGYFTLLGEKFKEAQRLLADHAGGTFEKWYTALGFKRQTVYNLIQRYDFLSSPVIEGRENTFEELPATLSYEISKPNAPQSLVEKVLDGDITTNAQYMQLKSELEEANKRAETAEMLSLTYKQNYDQMNKNFQEACEDNTNLEKRIRELEKRPVDVAVEQNDDVMNELEQLRKENERLRDKNVKNFLLHMTIEEFEQLLDMTESSEYIHSIVSKADIIRL